MITRITNRAANTKLTSLKYDVIPVVVRSPKQAYLIGFDGLGAKTFGGSTIKGNPRDARPISTKNPMHLVMRSSHATGTRSFLKGARVRQIETLVYRLGKQTGVRVYRYANSGNHLHLVVLPRSRRAFHAYLRAISGLIARITLGAERGSAADVQFWDARPFTRILQWGKDFQNACRYVLQNTLEAIGFLPYQPRKSKPPPGT